jgi:hypothetical protein
MKIDWREYREDIVDSKIIFVKIPHCAGTSFQSLMENHEEYRSKIRLLFSYQLKQLKLNHESFKFSIIRNPWDRFISSWKHDRPNWTIEEFLEKLPVKKRRPKKFSLNSRFRWRRWSRWSHIAKQQTQSLLDNDDKLMVNKLIRFENLQEELGELFKKLGLSPVKFPHLNKSKRYKPYWEYYTDETRNKVAELFKKDIETFGYTFT